MEITVKRNILFELLQRVVGVISPKQTNPIYSHVLIEIESGAIRATASNIDLQISVAIELKTKANFSFVIPARKTIEILKNLKNEEIKIKVEKKEVIFSSEKYRFSLRALDYHQFKLIDDLKKPTIIKTKAAYLRNAIKSTVFVSMENSNLVYSSGILFKLNQNKVSAVSTDSYRMAMFEFSVKVENDADLDNDIEGIVPRKTAHEMQSILQNTEEEVSVEITPSEIALNAPGVRLVSKLLEGNFPNYSQLLGVDCKDTVMLRCDEFSQALKAVSVLGERDSPKAWLALNNDSIEVSLSRQEESGNYSVNNSEAKIQIPFQVEVVSRYLIEAIDSLASSQAKIEFPESRKTLLVRGVEASTDSIHVVSLIKE